MHNLTFPRLTAEQCERIHAASLAILDRVGVRLDLADAREMLKKAGATVDADNLVHLPAHLVETALSTAPREVAIWDRCGENRLLLGGDRCFYGPGSDCLHLLDHRTHVRRAPTTRDVAEGVALCDSLENIDFVMSMLLPTDVDTAVADRVQMELMLSVSTKPIVYVTYGFEGCVDCVRMAEAVAGGAEPLQEHPNIACYTNAISGLHHNEDALQKLLYLSNKNLPVLYIPSSTAGVSSPITPAGALAYDHAGVLVGIVLSQLAREGAPIVVPGMPPGQLDMRTMVSTYCEPERGFATAMAHYLDLPMFSLGGASESKLADQQAAAEAALSLVVETLGGGNLIHDVGYLESGLTFSFVQLVICNEIVSWIKGFTKPIDLSDEALGLRVIADVGADAQFLETEHTLTHFRERWYPGLFDRTTHDSWLGRGGRDLAAVAAERVEKILAAHEPVALSESSQRALAEILGRGSAQR